MYVYCRLIDFEKFIQQKLVEMFMSELNLQISTQDYF